MQQKWKWFGCIKNLRLEIHSPVENLIVICYDWLLISVFRLMLSASGIATPYNVLHYEYVLYEGNW